MPVRGEYLADAGNGDARPLLDSKRMVRGLELDERPLTIIPQVHDGLEVLGLGVAIERGREPAEEWPGVRTHLLGIKLEKRFEVLAAQRHPQTPDEGLRLTEDRHFEARASEEEPFIDDACISVEATPGRPLRPRNGVVVQGRVGAQPRHAFVALSAR